MAFALHSQLAAAEKISVKNITKNSYLQIVERVAPTCRPQRHKDVTAHDGTKYPHDAKKTLLCACGQHIATPYTAA